MTTFGKQALYEERIYYDRAAILSQIGLFHEPSTAIGRSLTALTHPLTVLRAYASAAFTRIRNTRNAN